MKKIVRLEFLISYPKFSKKFIIHTDDSNKHLGGIMSQNGNM